MADEKNKGGGIINNFYGNVNNVINGDYHAHAPVSNTIGTEARKSHEGKEDKVVPTFEEMMTVFKKANQNGLWSSMRSWGVGFQMWQIWGWEGSVIEFVDLVINSGKMEEFDYECNLNAVYKMMNKGHMSRHLDNWRSDGVLEPYCILGEQINDELLKLYPPKIDERNKIEEPKGQ